MSMSIHGIIIRGVSAAFVIVAGSGVPLEADESKPEGAFAQFTTLAQATPPQAAPATAQPTPSRGPGWALNCKSEVTAKALDCRLSQTVVTENRQMLANVTFHFPPAPQKPDTIIQVPLGVLLPAGATLQIDENAAQKLNFRACDRNGCYIQAPLSPDALAQLRKGKQVTVAFKNLSENDIKVPLSLDGFEEAYGKVPSS